MFRDKRIGVVVPAYNEELLIGRVIETMPDFVDHIIVVDDRSKDGTAERVEEFKSALNSRLVLVRHEENRGVGGAITTGYGKAIEMGIDVTAVMAGDAQMDPGDLERIIEPVVCGEADYTKGNRLFRGDAWNVIPRYRYLGNSFLSLLTKIASGYWRVADSQTGYTAISLEALQALPLHKVYPRYGYPNDMLVRLNVEDFRVKDVPIKPVYNIGERSGIKLWKLIPRLSLLLFKRFWWRLLVKYVVLDFHPLVFFYLLAFLLFPVGAVLGIIFAYKFMQGYISVSSVVLSAFCLISSLQSMLFAMWFDMDYNRRLNV